MRLSLALALLLAGLSPARLSAEAIAPAPEYILYAGTFTRPTPETTSAARGIYAWRFSPGSGQLAPLGLMAEAINPAHLCAHPNQRFLYAVNWATGDSAGDTVSAYAIEARTGALTFLNQVSSQGASPNQVVLDPSGRIAVAVTYRGGTVTAFAIHPDGRLSEAFYVDRHTGTPASPKQTGAHVHGIVFSADGRHAYVADLGLDRIYHYSVDADNLRFTPADPAFFTMAEAGSGPRRLQLHPNGRFLYVDHETNAAVSVFALEPGALRQIQTVSTRPADYPGKVSPAEIQIDRTGRWLYVANRGPDNLACFSIDPSTGLLAPAGQVPAGGKNPRNLAIDPTNRFVVSSNQSSDNLAFFTIDPADGHLTATGLVIELPQPAGVCFVAVP